MHTAAMHAKLQGHNHLQSHHMQSAHRHPLHGVIHKHALHQLNAGWLQAGKCTCHLLCLPVWELMPVSELAHTRPYCLIWSSQELEDVQQLLKLTVARE